MNDAGDKPAGGFLARWSRRKAGLEVEVPAAATGIPAAPALARPVAVQPPAAAPEAGSQPQAEPPALPTLDDVALLTRQSDYSRFVAAGVEPEVKNAALKKLFSDPHFNIMDGLDTYIDDYGKPDPIPPWMLRAMNQSAVLGLFDDEKEAEAALPAVAAAASPDGSGPAAVAQSPAADTDPAPALPALAIAPGEHPGHDDDADLRLQQDDAARRPGPDPGPRA